MRNGGAIVRALSEADWWRLVRGVEGVGGDGVLTALPSVAGVPTFTESARARDRLVLWLLGGVGLRVAEACGLLWSDLVVGDVVTRVLVVRAGVAKGGREREVPLSELVRAAVSRALGSRRESGVVGDGPVLWSRVGSGTAMTTRRVQQMVGCWGGDYLQRWITPHMLRHTFASRLRRRVDLAVVQRLLGHARLSSTQVYMGVESSELTAAVESLDA